MSDDRRLGPRRWAHVTAMVNHGRLGLTRCMLRDISLEGAFVQTPRQVLAKDDIVELVLRVRAGKHSGHCRVPAKVARVTYEGAALLFDDPNEQLYRTLFDIVHVPAH